MKKIKKFPLSIITLIVLIFLAVVAGAVYFYNNNILNGIQYTHPSGHLTWVLADEYPNPEKFDSLYFFKKDGKQYAQAVLTSPDGEESRVVTVEIPGADSSSFAVVQNIDKYTDNSFVFAKDIQNAYYIYIAGDADPGDSPIGVQKISGADTASFKVLNYDPTAPMAMAVDKYHQYGCDPQYQDWCTIIVLK